MNFPFILLSKMDTKPSPTLKTPTVGAKTTLSESTVIEMEASPKSNGMEAIDLDIKNLEGTPDMRHKRSASESVVPKENRRSPTRRYSLDIGPTTAQDHAALAAENEKKRRTSEKIFKIMLIFVILMVIGLITCLMICWELGYFNKQDGFSAPVFY